MRSGRPHLSSHNAERERERERERTEERYQIREVRSLTISQADLTRLQWIGPRGGDVNGLVCGAVGSGDRYQWSRLASG